MAYYEKISSQEINKLKRLRSKTVVDGYILSRDEIQYIIDCVDKFGIVDIKAKTSWNFKNYESLKRKIHNLQVKDIDPGKMFEFKTVRDVLLYFNPTFIDPTPQNKLISLFDKVKIAHDRSVIDNLGELRYCYSCPPRSCKSELITAFIFWLMFCHPYLRILYVTNSQRNAERLSEKVRSWMKLLKVKINSSFDSKSYWMIDEIPGHPVDKITSGGTLSVYTPESVPQGITADVIFVDDLYKSLEQANSFNERTKINEGFFGNILTRRTPDCPVFVISTRYRHDDLIAELVKEHKWRYDNIPAIVTDKHGIEKSYWPEYWSLNDILTAKKNSEFNFQAIYMGNPVPRESSLFNNIRYYEGNVPTGCELSYGLDLAYSAKEKSDYSVLVKMYYHKLSDTYYVSEIFKWHEKITSVLPKIKELVGNSKVHFKYGGQEGGIIDLAKADYKLNIDAEKAIQDKYQRSLPLADKFFKVLFSKNIEQTSIDEIKTFTGLNDKHDDVVDALVNAFDSINSNSNSQEVKTLINKFSTLNLRFR